MYKILITENMGPDGTELLKQQEDLTVDVRTGLAESELLDLLPDYDALIIRSHTDVNASVLRAGKRLKIVARAGIGVNNIDVEEATRLGIYVVNCPTGNTISAAEHTIALMLSLCRNVPAADATLRKNVWDKKSFTGLELHDKTLGIIGLGKIGSLVATRMMAFEMDVVAYDPYISDEKAARLGVKRVELAELLTVSDVITVHTPLTEETRGMIGAEQFALMKPTVRLVNCARGGIYDEDALAEALEQEQIGGFALDVFLDEPEMADRLINLNRTVFTPHLGGSTQEALKKISLIIAEQVMKGLRTEEFDHVVNMPVIGTDLAPSLQPFLPLADKIGVLQRHLAEGSIKEVKVSLYGELAEASKLFAIRVLKGLLQGIVDTPINYVNAFQIAKERGIDVVESTLSVEPDFTHLIQVTVRSNLENTIQGTIFGKDPRIIGVNDYILDFTPEGNILLLRNKDVPGVIGEVATILGTSGVNIAEWRLGRVGLDALCVVNLDAAAPSEVISRIQQSPNITLVRQIAL